MSTFSAKLTEIARAAIVESMSDPDTAKALIGEAITGVLDLSDYKTKQAIEQAVLEAVRIKVGEMTEATLKTPEYQEKLRAKVDEVMPLLTEKLADAMVRSMERMSY